VSAGRLAGTLLASAVMLPACLIPQTDYILQPLPPAKNQPPRILESLVQPPGRFVTVRNGSSCPNLAFSAPVSDPDVTDTLVYNFYVDADVNPGFVKQGIIGVDGQAIRSEPATYEVSFATANPLQQPGDHLVEVLVADGQLAGRTPLPRPVQLPDGGTVLDTTFAVTYAWAVTVTVGPCP